MDTRMPSLPFHWKVERCARASIFLVVTATRAGSRIALCLETGILVTVIAVPLIPRTTHLREFVPISNRKHRSPRIGNQLENLENRLETSLKNGTRTRRMCRHLSSETRWLRRSRMDDRETEKEHPSGGGNVEPRRTNIRFTVTFHRDAPSMRNMQYRKHYTLYGCTLGIQRRWIDLLSSRWWKALKNRELLYGGDERGIEMRNKETGWGKKRWWEGK